MSENFAVTVINTFLPHSELAMFYILLTLFSIWLYKQFRTYLIENIKNTTIKTDKAIEVYCELEITIRRMLQEKAGGSSIDGIITKASSFLPIDLLKEYYNWTSYLEGDEGKFKSLKLLHQKIRDELLKLKKAQLDSVTYKNNGGMIDYIEVYYKTKLASVVEPLFHTAVSLLVLLITIVIFEIISVTHEWTQKIFLISTLITVVCFLLVIDLIFSEIILKKRFKHSTKNWVIFGLYIIIPVPLVFWRQWYVGIIMLSCIFAYAFYVNRYSIQNVGRNRVV
jgi:hypothetical protein